MISRGYAGLPPHTGGQRIGLFGGTFNPPHEGHRAASLMALHRLKLDWIWWLITPGNPFKDVSDLPPMADRIDAARHIAAHPRIVVTGVEASLGSRYTCDIIRALGTRLPSVQFVLIVGADSFASFHRWKHWRRIAYAIPIAVIDRPGFTFRATQMTAAKAFTAGRLPEADAAALASSDPPAWIFLHGPRSNLSSTQLR